MLPRGICVTNVLKHVFRESNIKYPEYLSAKRMQIVLRTE